MWPSRWPSRGHTRSFRWQSDLPRTAVRRRPRCQIAFRHAPMSLKTERRTGGAAMLTLYSMQRSGNSYKVRLALAQLGLPYRLEEIDILKGESRTPEFLAKNPSGQVPLLEVEPGRFISES